MRVQLCSGGANGLCPGAWHEQISALLARGVTTAEGPVGGACPPSRAQPPEDATPPPLSLSLRRPGSAPGSSIHRAVCRKGGVCVGALTRPPTRALDVSNGGYTCTHTTGAPGADRTVASRVTSHARLHPCVGHVTHMCKACSVLLSASSLVQLQLPTAKLSPSPCIHVKPHWFPQTPFTFTPVLSRVAHFYSIPHCIPPAVCSRGIPLFEFRHILNMPPHIHPCL